MSVYFIIEHIRLTISYSDSCFSSLTYRHVCVCLRPSVFINERNDIAKKMHASLSNGQRLRVTTREIERRKNLFLLSFSTRIE